jgi:nucleoside-diphosphate-sugar epimerase
MCDVQIRARDETARPLYWSGLPNADHAHGAGGRGGRRSHAARTGDALDRDSIVAAAQGTSAIVHAVNPPGYRNWAALVLPMIENTIAAAKASGARIVIPGTIYNFGPDAFPVLREDSPQRATTHKGKIRIALEQT